MQGLQVLHSCGFCSMDCKSDNVMVSMGPLGEDLHCTLVDLGSAARINAGRSGTESVLSLGNHHEMVHLSRNILTSMRWLCL